MHPSFSFLFAQSYYFAYVACAQYCSIILSVLCAQGQIGVRSFSTHFCHTRLPPKIYQRRCTDHLCIFWRHFFYLLSLLVLGANGRTGLEIVRQGLERNYRVTAFVRDDKLLLEDTTLRKNQNLLIVRGSPTSQADLDRCVEGQDVVVNVIGVCLLFECLSVCVCALSIDGCEDGLRNANYPISLGLPLCLV